MKASLKISIFILFVVPILILAHKHYNLKLSILPQEMSDEWDLEVKMDPSSITTEYEWRLPAPVSQEYQEIQQLHIKTPKGLSAREERTKEGVAITWSGDFTTLKTPLSYAFRARTQPSQIKIPEKISFRSRPKDAARYLSTENYSIEDRDAMRELSSAIVTAEPASMAALRNIFFYVSEEIRLTTVYHSIPESLALGRGTPYTKAKIFNYLVRSQGIPARTGIGVQLEPEETSRPPKNQYRLVFYSEIFLNGQWYPIDLQQRKMGGLPENFIVIERDIESYEMSYKTLQTMQVFAVPIRTNRFDTKVYSDELKRSGSLFYTFSLYSLPLSAQHGIYIILLLPLGAVLVSLFRNLVGFNTFGIFTPVLLTLFFMETQFYFAFVFFFLVVLLGFFQRILLDKLYLLAVPRLSILLTFVIIAYVLFILLNQNVIDISGAGSGILNYFPIVIITILIERFSIDFIEEGTWNTFKKLAGTITISVLCYFVLTFKILQQLLFTNPELLLWTIAINLMIGNYKGYRLSEFFRFKELSQKVNV